MNKIVAAFLLFFISFSSCNKEDEPTKFDQYRNIVFRIDARDSDLTVKISYAIFENGQRKGIIIDTVFPDPSVYSIPAKVLVNEPATIFGLSYRSGDYGLQILSGNNVLVGVDSLPYFPSTQLDPDRWFTTIKAYP